MAKLRHLAIACKDPDAMAEFYIKAFDFENVRTLVYSATWVLSPTASELDTRGSHFYLAMYWAEALAAQTQDMELQARFSKVAKQLAENEAKIVAELNAAQGKPVEIGGYFRPNPELASKAMRPSATFNAIVDAVSGDGAPQLRTSNPS